MASITRLGLIGVPRKKGSFLPKEAFVEILWSAEPSASSDWNKPPDASGTWSAQPSSSDTWGEEP